MGNYVFDVFDALLPPCHYDHELVLVLVRGPKWRHVSDDGSRKNKLNGHVFLVLRGKGISSLVISFGPKYLTGKDIPKDRVCPPGVAGLEDVSSLYQFLPRAFLHSVLHFQGLKLVEGRVDHQGDVNMAFDTCRIFPITQEQRSKVLHEIANDKQKPLQYQLAGFGANNCVAYAANLLTRVGVGVPLLMKLLPWPSAVSLCMGFENVLRDVCGISPRKHIAVSPHDIRHNMAQIMFMA